MTNNGQEYALVCRLGQALLFMFAAIVCALQIDVFGPAPLSAQERKGDAAVLPTATLLMRVAQAVDGFRTGDTLFVVAQDEFPHDVSGVFTDREDALRAAQPGFSVHGPFATQLDFDRVPILLVARGEVQRPICPGHLPWSQCALFPVLEADALPIPFHDITRTEIRFFSGDSLVAAVAADAAIDAAFFNLSALDKFFIPYLSRVLGAGYAAGFRDSVGVWIMSESP